MANLAAKIQEIHDFGADIVSPGQRVVACAYISNVLFANANAVPLFWPGWGVCQEIPGLPTDVYYSGIASFQGHVILWRSEFLKWSAQNDFTEWIPVGETTVSKVFQLQVPYTLGRTGQESDWIYVDESAAELIVGQFLRIDKAPYYTFFEVTAVLPSVGVDGKPSGSSQSVAPGATQDIFLNAFVPYVKGAQVYFDGNAATMEVNDDAVAPGSASAALSEDFTNPAPNDRVTVTVTLLPALAPGTYVSIGAALSPGQDIFLIEAIDYTTSTMTLRRMGVGLSSPETHYAGEFLVGQPSINVTNLSDSVAASGSFVTPLKERHGFKVKPLDLTGAAPLGTVFPVDTEIFTVDANGAGELQNVGQGVNGPILWFDTLSDYGYIFKKRSIQSVQYVGPDSGTFFIRPEITDEGLIGNYAFVKVGQDTLYFIGHRDIYRYGGGNQLIPIAQQQSRQFFRELNLAKANQIIGYHNEMDKEIWFIYPRVDQPDFGPLRVLIYNYEENSCTLDDYDEELQALTAVGRLQWSTDIIWEDSLGTWVSPASWPASATWDDLGADEADSYTILGAANDTRGSGGESGDESGLLVHGAGNYSRLGEAYECVAETTDYDNGDPMAWKYVDTIMFALQVRTQEPDLQWPLYVSVGTRVNFDDPITWSDEAVVYTQGAGQRLTKVNIRASGKFLRLRFRSNTAGMEWRIGEFRILGRLGSTY